MCLKVLKTDVKNNLPKYSGQARPIRFESPIIFQYCNLFYSSSKVVLQFIVFPF